MVTPPTLSERFRYTFDALIARGAWVLLFWHLIASLAAVVAISLMVAALGMTPVDEQSTAIGFGELVWLVLMHAIDPGTVTGDEGGGAWRAIMLVATIFGILLVGSLVAVLVESVANRFDQLRRGRSRVLEHDHTLVLGWSRQILTIISELAIARAGKPHCVVICAEHDKVWMEEQLRAKIGRGGQTCLQSGLSVVYEELLGFEGSELYFIGVDELVGRDFAHAVHHFEDASLLGIRRADGTIQLKPPADAKLGRSDKLIAIATDDRWNRDLMDGRRRRRHNRALDPRPTRSRAHAEPRVERPGTRDRDRHRRLRDRRLRDLRGRSRRGRGADHREGRPHVAQHHIVAALR